MFLCIYLQNNLKSEAKVIKKSASPRPVAGKLADLIKRGEDLSPDRRVHVALGLYIEAGTFLYPFLGFYRPIAVQVRAEIPVACYYFYGELLLQCLDKPYHGVFLFGCAGVAGIALAVESALVADAYAAFVVATAVGSYELDGTHIANLSRTTDVKMIPASVETALTVYLDQCGWFEPRALGRCRTVNDYCVNMSHCLLLFLCRGMPR